MIRRRDWGVLLALLASAPVSAAFLDNGATARIAALGDSYAAMADDAAALTVNAAGLGLLRQPEAVADYSRPYAGLSDGSSIAQYYLGFAQPLRGGGAVAVGWKGLNFADLYKERTLTVGYGRRFGSHWAAGVAVKQLHHAFNAPQQVVDDYGNVQAGTPDLFAQNGAAQDAYSADLGVLLLLSPRSRVGLSIQDLNEPNLALSPSDRDVLHRTYRLAWAGEPRRRWTVAGGLRSQETLAGQRDVVADVGTEAWFDGAPDHQYGLRGSIAAGSRAYRSVTTGAGYRLNALQFDYAFTLNLSGIVLGDTYGTHRFSMAYRFGAPAAAAPLTMAAADARAIEAALELLTPETAR